MEKGAAMATKEEILKKHEEAVQYSLKQTGGIIFEVNAELGSWIAQKYPQMENDIDYLRDNQDEIISFVWDKVIESMTEKEYFRIQAEMDKINAPIMIEYWKLLESMDIEEIEELSRMKLLPQLKETVLQTVRVSMDKLLEQDDFSKATLLEMDDDGN